MPYHFHVYAHSDSPLRESEALRRFLALVEELDGIVEAVFTSTHLGTIDAAQTYDDVGKVPQ